MSGGSVANTVAGFANLGGKAGYIGREDDQLGEIFVRCACWASTCARNRPRMARPPRIIADGQRTMQTYLGACTELSVDDVTATTVGKTDIVLPGCVWDIAEGPELAQAAMRLAAPALRRRSIRFASTDAGLPECGGRWCRYRVRRRRRNRRLYESTDSTLRPTLRQLDRLFVLTRSAQAPPSWGSERIEQRLCRSPRSSTARVRVPIRPRFCTG